ncbi:MAG: DUF1207 domain-containing protein [Verrucomicrobia bacterium]|nr:DUF1207 domain-containing protein [Verrucomicrobiota bacterium]
MRKGIFCGVLVALTCSLVANEKDDSKIVAYEVPEDFQFDDKGAQKHRTYLEAYLQGCLDSKFPHSGVVVVVRHGDVILTKLPKDKDRAKRIETYVKNFVANSLMDDVVGLNVVLEHAEKDAEIVKTSGSHGMWLPQSTVLFPSQVANPRQVSFSGGIRLRDSIAGQVSTPVSFGDQFPLYRWSNVDLLSTKGDLQLEVEGAVFAIFNQTCDSSPLINADYYVAVPLSFAHDNWAYRLRLYHISSHLGDEYLKRKDHAKRLNKSYEAIDYFVAYTINKQVLFYGGPGVIVHSDSEMHLKPLYAQYGMEVRLFRHEFKQLYGVPYIAMHLENWQDNDWKIDATFALGYEWGKLNGMGKKIRASIEYHNGYCDAGQFSRIRDDYVQFRLSYGF